MIAYYCTVLHSSPLPEEFVPNSRYICSIPCWGAHDPFGDTFDMAALLAGVIGVGVMRLVRLGVSLRDEVACR